MDADPRFHAWYRRVRMFGDDPVPLRFNIHCRLEGRVGVERSDGRVTMPGFLFASAKGTHARLDENGRLVTRFLAPVQTTLTGVELGAGTWRLRVDGSGTLRLAGGRQSDGAAATPTVDGIELVMSEPGLVDISVTGAESASISEVVADRVAP